MDLTALLAQLHTAISGVNPWWLLGAGLAAASIITALTCQRIYGRRQTEAFEAGLQQNASAQADERRMSEERLAQIQDKANMLLQAGGIADAASRAVIETVINETSNCSGLLDQLSEGLS